MNRIVNFTNDKHQAVSIINYGLTKNEIYGFDFDRKWTDNNQVEI